VFLSYFASGLNGPETDLLKAVPRSAGNLRACLAPEARLILFAFTHQGLAAYDCALDPNALQVVSPYRMDGQRFLDARVLRRAYAALVAPVAGAVQQAQQLIVAPHGPLHQLSFAALLDEQGRPLLKTMPPMVYVPSATIMLQLLARPALDRRWDSPCLALGYDGTSMSLRHTEPEAEAVARITGGEARRGRPGQLTQFLEQASRYRWLHLACHGEFDLAEPLRSWLELGPGEHLRASDVLESPRMHTELVTLSACRSGVSKVLRGDEPMGLVRAFLAAGVQTVVVTLWQVEDRSARLLMEHFYALLAEPRIRQDPASALREAQVDERVRAWGEMEPNAVDAPDVEHPYADPSFWAAYVVVGVAPASISTARFGIASAGT
jgi:CHAT domain-containing protein